MWATSDIEDSRSVLRRDTGFSLSLSLILSLPIYIYTYTWVVLKSVYRICDLCRLGLPEILTLARMLSNMNLH